MILQNTSATISVSLSIDGVAVDPTPDSATVAVYREDGTELVAETAATDAGTGIFEYVLTPTQTAQLDRLRAVWKMDINGEEQTLTTYHGIVGGFLCTLEAISAAILASGGTEPSAAELRARRTEAERKLEDACGVAFRPSYARDRRLGDGQTDLVLDRPRATSIITATIDGASVDLSELVLIEETLHRAGGWTSRKVVEIAYEHGFPAPPETISRAAVILAASYIDNTGGERINRFSEDGQEFFLSLPGNGRDTGIPEVDQAISDHRFVTVG